MKIINKMIESGLKKAAKDTARFLKEAIRISKEMRDTFMEEFSKDIIKKKK